MSLVFLDTGGIKFIGKDGIEYLVGAARYKD